MKFGIVANHKDGKVQYVCSTRYRPELTDDISSIALFAQESNAIDAVKTIRKDGLEPEDVEFLVVGITFLTTKVTQVPYPEKKQGFVIRVEGDQVRYQFYIGTKKPGQYIQYHAFGNAERATVFSAEREAKVRLDQLIQEGLAELDRVVNQDLYYLRETEREICRQRDIESAWTRLNLIKSAIIEKV